MKKILLISLFVFGLIRIAFTQQLYFNEQIVGTNQDFEYEVQRNPRIPVRTLLPQGMKPFKVSFSLNTKLIKESYELIPNLNDLKRSLKTVFEREAQILKEEPLRKLNTAFNNDLQKLILNNSRKKNSVQIACESEEPIQLIFTFYLNGNHQAQQKIASCKITTNMDTQLVERNVQKIVDATNKKLKYGSQIRIHSNGRQFRLETKIQAPNETEKKKIEEIIAQSFKQIENSQNQTIEHSIIAKKNAQAVSTELEKIYNFYDVQVSQLRTSIEEEFNQLLTQEFEKRYFKLTQEKNNVVSITLNFARIARESIPLVKNVSNSLFDESLSKRAQIQKILTFLQTIPYNTLQGREVAGYSGFLPPLALLDKNMGDCDTKSVALVSLLKNIYPEIALMIVLIEGHAFVGLDIPAEKSDATINYKNRTYVIAEPVGPATVEIGTPSEASAKAIKRNEIHDYIKI